ncbi:MAG: hypothetical protein J2P53_16035, partial [Bradyrhizobiaceae bacterium]|nr:hypothetical protein [Bradyrhizobiaceae bacterium]
MSPLLLAQDRPHGLRFDGSTVHPPTAALWGRGWPRERRTNENRTIAAPVFPVHTSPRTGLARRETATAASRLSVVPRRR